MSSKFIEFMKLYSDPSETIEKFSFFLEQNRQVETLSGGAADIAMSIHDLFKKYISEVLFQEIPTENVQLYNDFERKTKENLKRSLQNVFLHKIKFNENSEELSKSVADFLVTNVFDRTLKLGNELK